MALKDAPEKLQPYLFHGVDLVWSGTSDAVGDCPFCGKERHFYVSQKTGMFQCKVCGSGTDKGGGNSYTFLSRFWESCREANYDVKELEQLAKSKGVAPKSLIRWGIAKSTLRDEWMVPGFNQDKSISNLYRYALVDSEKNKRAFLSTPGCKNTLFGMQNWDPKKKKIKLCEGFFDGVCMDEALSRYAKEGDQLVRVLKGEPNLLDEYNVLAVPGCEVFRDVWGSIFKESKVELLYDSDHPRRQPKSDELLPPAGFKGMEKAHKIIRGYTKDISIIYWGPDGFDPSHKSGYDVRDIYIERGAKAILELPLAFPPEDWVGASDVLPDPTDKSKPKIQPKECTSFKVLVNAWRKALKWTDNLNTTLAVMLACVTSTEAHGDQLWIRIIGPPSSGKSTLCEALSASRFAFPTSVVRGFHSGYTGPGGENSEGGGDSSLIPLINNKTVIMKESDTLLTAPNSAQILGEMRDLYDRVTRSNYKNKKHSVYEGLNTTVIIAGTASIKRLNKSYLGDRFLDCIIYDRSNADPDLEKEIVRRAIYAALRNVKIRNTGEQETRYSPAILEATQLTIGYMEYLRENADKLLSSIECDDKYIPVFESIGNFVAIMRARPDKEQSDEEDGEIELPARLSSQFTRLAVCLSVVLNETKVTDEVMTIVTKIVLDTSKGLVWSIVNYMLKHKEGLDARAIWLGIRRPDNAVRKMLGFMHTINAIRPYERANNSGARGRNRNLWELRASLKNIIKSALTYRKHKNG